jgi:alpha,alpha-trehalose phosphorylase
MSTYDPRLAGEGHRYLTSLSCEIKDGASYITSATSKSELEVCSCVKNVLLQKSQQEFSITDNNHAISIYKAEAFQGEKIKLIKYCVFCDSIRHSDCKKQAAIELKKALDVSLQDLYSKQEEYLSDYWNNCLINIEGNAKFNQAIRYSLYQLIQSVGKDRFSNIAPKGLSGDGYEGHFFWDSEMYAQPFFTITNPSLSKNLIEYRYATLDMARENAQILGHDRGALYPAHHYGKNARIFSCRDCQYHINGDIAYSIIAYYLATKDCNSLRKKVPK